MRTGHIADMTQYLVQVLSHEVREIVGIPHDDRFPSSAEAPPPFYEFNSEDGDDDITHEANDVEYVAPQERCAGEGISEPLADDAAEEDDDDEQFSQDISTQFPVIQMSS